MIHWKFSLRLRLGFIFLGFYLIGGSFLLFQLLGGADLLSGTPAIPALASYFNGPFSFFFLPVFWAWIVCGFIPYPFYLYFGDGEVSPAMHIITFLLCGVLWFYVGYGIGVLIEKVSGRARNN